MSSFIENDDIRQEHELKKLEGRKANFLQIRADMLRKRSTRIETKSIGSHDEASRELSALDSLIVSESYENLLKKIEAINPDYLAICREIAEGTRARFGKEYKSVRRALQRKL